MKNLLKKKWLITLLSVGIFISTFGAEAEKKPEEKKETPKVEKTGFLSNIRQLKELSDIMDVINQNYVGDKPIDKKLLMQGALKGMVESLEDPHSNYFTSEELKDFQEDIKGKYVGVGMVVQKRPNEALTVVSPIEDSPAYKAGMKPKDKIIAIDGQPTYKLTSEECVKKLKGKENTTVKVTVIRDGVKDPKDIEIKRAVVELKYVKSRICLLYTSPSPRDA